MRIAIIGKGNVGTALCKGLSGKQIQSLVTETLQNRLVKRRNGVK